MKENLTRFYAALYVVAVVVLALVLGKLTYSRAVKNDPEVLAIENFDEALSRAKRLVREEAGVELKDNESLTLLKTGDGRYVYRIDTRDLWGTYEHVGEEREFTSTEARDCLDRAIRYRGGPAGFLEEASAYANARALGIGNAIFVAFLILVAGFATPLVISYRQYCQADSLDALQEMRPRRMSFGQDDDYWDTSQQWDDPEDDEF